MSQKREGPEDALRWQRVLVFVTRRTIEMLSESETCFMDGHSKFLKPYSRKSSQLSDYIKELPEIETSSPSVRFIIWQSIYNKYVSLKTIPTHLKSIFSSI